MKVVVLLSGGIDSVTLLHHCASGHHVVAALGFHYGSKHNNRELPFAEWQATQLGVPFHQVPLDFVARHFSSHLLASGGSIPEGHYEEATMRQTVVPFRNGIMLAIAAGFAESVGAQAVAIAAHSGDHAIYPDCRETFLQAMTAAIAHGTYEGIEILRPFVHLTKSEIVSRGTALGVDFSRTWSCYVGGERHCGRCGTCVERREAFLLANQPDPTEYLHTDPLPPKPALRAVASDQC
ncbi:MAG: 7-cyano-7-deazaguanine synthase QueC [Verrucomicrobiia bacterium]